MMRAVNIESHKNLRVEISWRPSKLWINRPTIFMYFLDSLNDNFRCPWNQGALILFASPQKKFFLMPLK